jgi:hypothetical protein
MALQEKQIEIGHGARFAVERAIVSPRRVACRE